MYQVTQIVNQGRHAGNIQILLISTLSKFTYLFLGLYMNQSMPWVYHMSPEEPPLSFSSYIFPGRSYIENKRYTFFLSIFLMALILKMFTS